MPNLIGLVVEAIATIVVETVAWLAKVLFCPSRQPEAQAIRTPRELPDGTAPRIVAALAAGHDAATLLPNGWRGFHSSIVDAPSPKPGDTVTVGSELLLVPRPEPVGEMMLYTVVAPLHSSTVPLGTLTNQDLDRSIQLGRVRCWLAGRKSTLINASAAVIFIAVYDP